MIKLNDKVYTCPVDLTLSFIGGKWKLLILSHLHQFAKKSYSEIRDNLPGVSEKMLSQQLKELERNALIEKKTFVIEAPQGRIFSFKKWKVAFSALRIYQQMGNRISEKEWY